MRSSDFAGIISMMAPGTSVYLTTSRDGETREVSLTLGSTQCTRAGVHTPVNLSLPARYASIQQVPTGILRVLLQP
jgi:hypothetical protein